MKSTISHSPQGDLTAKRSNRWFTTGLTAIWMAVVMLCVTSCQPQNVPIITPEGEGEAIARPANTTVVYECNERLFAKTDAFKTIEAYVPELERMGVNVLWLMPIHPIGQDTKAIGSPYCVRDYKGINPDFGTMADLKHLVATAHDHNMRVVLDWIANHTSWDNTWTTTHPDWYEGPSTGDEQHWADVTFLNYNLQAVRDTMKECMLYWVREADIDGFRCDYAGGVPLDWWKEVNEAVLALKPNAFLLAETSDARHFDAGFQMLYSWSYLYAIEDIYSGKGSLSNLLSAHNSEYNSTPADKQRLRYITTHDETAEKAPASIYRDAQGELSAFCLAAFMGGVPMIYSSQELGNLNTINFFEYNIMDFAAQNSTRDALAWILKIYRDTEALRGGTQLVSSLAARVPYVEYTRDNQALLVICNAANTEQQVKLPMRYEGIEMTDLLTDKTTTLEAVTTLQPHEYRIYKK